MNLYNFMADIVVPGIRFNFFFTDILELSSFQVDQYPHITIASVLQATKLNFFFFCSLCLDDIVHNPAMKTLT